MPIMVSFFVARLCILCLCVFTCAAAGEYDGKVVKGNRNALFLVQDGRRSAFPDFYTFTQMGFNMSVIQKIPDDILNNMPMGTPIKAIAVYRGEDYMYHRVCSDPDRLVSFVSCTSITGTVVAYLLLTYSCCCFV